MPAGKQDSSFCKGLLIINRQDGVRVKLPRMRAYMGNLRAALGLGRSHFNVCLVNDKEIKRLNTAFRGSPHPTDVLSFPWKEAEDGGKHAEFKGFLGDVVISVERAWRSARQEGHSLDNEMRWLILHGLLHLLGYDHKKDGGEMTALELSLRGKLGI